MTVYLSMKKEKKNERERDCTDVEINQSSVTAYVLKWYKKERFVPFFSLYIDTRKINLDEVITVHAYLSSKWSKRERVKEEINCFDLCREKGKSNNDAKKIENEGHV